MNVDVRGLPAEAAHGRLMNENARVGRQSVALGARQQKKCSMLAAWPMQ